RDALGRPRPGDGADAAGGPGTGAGGGVQPGRGDAGGRRLVRGGAAVGRERPGAGQPGGRTMTTEPDDDSSADYPALPPSRPSPERLDRITTEWSRLNDPSHFVIRYAP